MGQMGVRRLLSDEAKKVDVVMTLTGSNEGGPRQSARAEDMTRWTRHPSQAGVRLDAVQKDSALRVAHRKVLARRTPADGRHVAERSVLRRPVLEGRQALGMVLGGMSRAAVSVPA